MLPSYLWTLLAAGDDDDDDVGIGNSIVSLGGGEYGGLD